MIRRDGKRQGIIYRQFSELHTSNDDTFQKCETKPQTCPIVNVHTPIFFPVRCRQKKICRRNRLRTECASQGKLEKSLQPQKNKGSGAKRACGGGADSPGGGILAPGLHRYSKNLVRKPRTYFFFMACCSARSPWPRPRSISGTSRDIIRVRNRTLLAQDARVRRRQGEIVVPGAGIEPPFA